MVLKALAIHMDKLKLRLIKSLRARAETAGINWSDFSEQTIEVVIFGSRPIAMNRHDSDLDVLAVGTAARRIKKCGLDLIIISTSDLGSPTWLGSELAGHVARYGLWMKGQGDWRGKVTSGPDTWKQKERRLISLMRSVRNSWTQLHPLFRLKYRTTIRRELQRLLLLQRSVPIPPTSFLDSEWQAGKVQYRALVHESEFICGEDRNFMLESVLD